jgi:hypothetical protein
MTPNFTKLAGAATGRGGARSARPGGRSGAAPAGAGAKNNQFLYYSIVQEVQP